MERGFVSSTIIWGKTYVKLRKRFSGWFTLCIETAIVPSRGQEYAHLLSFCRKRVLRRFEALIAARAPSVEPEQRRLIATVSHKIFLALLPLAVESDARQSNTIVGEMKAVLRGYLEPLIGLHGMVRTLSKGTTPLL